MYKNAENEPDCIVIKVAKWRQSRHFMPKSATMSGGTSDPTHSVTHSLTVQNFALITRLRISNAKYAKFCKGKHCDLHSFSRLEFHSFGPPIRYIWSPTKWVFFRNFFPGDSRHELGQG